MPHYVIGMMKVTDPPAMEAGMGEFIEKVRRSVAQYGGRFLVEGRVVALVEGQIEANGGSVIEFADAETARRWFESPEYTEARHLRERFGDAFHVLMQGIED